MSVKHLVDRGVERPIIFLAQIFKEAFSDYTSDSFRVPTMNTLMLIQEYLWILENRSIDRAHLKHLRKEICSFMKEDPIVSEIVGNSKRKYYQDIIYNAVEKNEMSESGSFEKKSKKDVDVDGVVIGLYRDVSDSYMECARDLIIRELRGDKRLRVIEILSHSVASLLKKRFSYRFINDRIDEFFFSENSSCDVSEFFKSFDIERKDFVVYFNASEEIANFLGHLPAFEVDPPRALMPRGKQGFRPDSGCKTVKITMGGYDEEGAYEDATNFIDFFSSIHLATAHLADISYSDAMLVWDGKSSHRARLVTPPLSDMKKREHAKKRKSITNDFLRHASFVMGRKEEKSILRTFATVRAHRRAVEASGPNNQVVMLWFAFEALMPERSEEFGGFEAYLKAAEGPIMLRYLRRRASFVLRYVTLAMGARLARVLRPIEGQGPLNKFLIALTDPAHVDVCDAIVADISADPLASYRLESFRQYVCNRDFLIGYCVRHWERVEWQLRRVYRVRNTLVHEGWDYPCDMSSLCVHFHEYYDTILDSLVMYSEKSKSRQELFSYFRHIASDYSAFKKRMQGMADHFAADEAREVYWVPAGAR